MKSNKQYEAPKITFAAAARDAKMPLYLGRYPDEVLLSDMERAADKEDYDVAIILRNELIRRGKL